MPFANNEGVQIHYEVEGQGDPLLLVHGMFVNWKWWRDTGLMQAMRETHRLIMIDVRGHGQSDKPHEPELYEVSLLVRDLVCVLDDLAVTKAHYLGFSMGGWLGFAAAKYSPERFRSFMLGGVHPYSDKAGHQVNLEKLPGWGLERIVAWFEEAGPVTEEQKRDLLSNDVQALVALAHDARADYSHLLPDISVPCLLYCGDADERFAGARKCADELPDATFVPLAGYDHLGVAFHATGELLLHVRAFLARTEHS